MPSSENRAGVAPATYVYSLTILSYGGKARSAPPDFSRRPPQSRSAISVPILYRVFTCYVLRQTGSCPSAGKLLPRLVFFFSFLARPPLRE
jgi:hypothetical protein